MKPIRACLPFVAALSAFAQLTPDQRVSDFLHLAGIYAKNYAPYGESRRLVGLVSIVRMPTERRRTAGRPELVS